MRKYFNRVTSYLVELANGPKNNSIAHNVAMLEDAKKKIETGIFSRYLKRPTIYIIETIAYSISISLLLVAIYAWMKIDNIFEAYNTLKFMGAAIVDKTVQLSDFSGISYFILFALMLPSIICFLLARLLTSTRKRINTFIEVENIISKTIYNLSE